MANLQGSDDVYDRAVKTIYVDAIEFILPLVNYMFGEKYTKKAKIRALSEQGLATDNEGRRRGTMDIHVGISENGDEKEYVIEVQSTRDGSILVRISKYAMGASMRTIHYRIRKGHAEIYSKMPDMGVVFLRAPRSLKSPAVLHVVTSEGEAEHHIQVVRMDEIDLDTILKNDLMFLVPFYLFRYVDELDEIRDDPQRMDELMEEYSKITKELRERVAAGTMTKPNSEMLASLTADVANQLARKYPKIREGVENMMHTDVLPWRPEDIREAAVLEGRKQGEIKGAIRSGRRHGDNDERIAADLAEDYGLSLEKARKEIWKYDHPQQ